MSGPPFNYADFHGGLNTYDSYDLLADNEARDLLNVQGTTAGAIVKRGGFQTFATPPNPLSRLYAYQLGVNVFIGADKVNGNLVQIATDGTVTNLKTALTNTGNWQFARSASAAGQGPYYLMDGVNTPQQWNGSAAGTSNWTNASGGIAVPNGSLMVAHQNQLFVALATNLTAPVNRLYWSAIGDPTNWDPASLTGAGFMDFDVSGGAITGLGTVGPYLVVFQSTKTWVLVDPATATVRRVSDNIGCGGSGSVAAAPDGLYFLAADRGVHVTNGSRITPIGDKIMPIFDSLINRGSSSGVWANSHYYLAADTSGSANNIILDFDVRLGTWWKHSVGVSQFAAVAGSSTSSTLFAAQTAASGGYVSKTFQPGVFQDNGSNFTWSWSGPWQSPTFYRRRRFPTPYFRKRMRQIRYDGIGQVDLSLCKDFDTSATLVASDIFGNSAITKEGRVYGQGVANVFSLVFSGTYPTAGQLNQYTLMVTDRKDSM